MALPKHVNTKEAKKFFTDNAVKVRDKTYANTFDAVQTAITDSATEIVLPDKAKWGLILMNPNSDTVWIGKDDTITVAGSNVFPLVENVPIELNLKTNSILYGIVSNGSVNIYVGGVIRE